MTKTCTRCGRELRLNENCYRYNKDGELTLYCPECAKIIEKEDDEKNKLSIPEQQLFQLKRIEHNTTIIAIILLVFFILFLINIFVNLMDSLI